METIKSNRFTPTKTLADTIRKQLDEALDLMEQEHNELRRLVRELGRSRRARRPKAELGFRGELGWQCLACGKGFEDPRAANRHVLGEIHCYECGRVVTTITEQTPPEQRLYRNDCTLRTLCELCSDAFMAEKLRRIAKREERAAAKRKKKVDLVLGIPERDR